MADETQQQERPDGNASIRYLVEDYIERDAPIRIVLMDKDAEGEDVEIDAISLHPESDLPEHIRRRQYCNGLERLTSGRVSQYSTEGNYYRFSRIKDEVLPMWLEGIWAPRKRSPTLEYRAVAEVFNVSAAAIKKEAKKAPEKFKQLLAREAVQAKLAELQSEGARTESVSLDSLLQQEPEAESEESEEEESEE